MQMREILNIIEIARTNLTEADDILDFDPMKNRTLFDLDIAASHNALDKTSVKAFRSLLDRDRDIRLYHGTSVQHDVWNKGLLPTSATRRRSMQSGSGFVYLTYDPQRALSFAQMGYPGEAPYVIYSVVVPVRMLKADSDQLFNKRMWGERPDIGSTLIDSLIHGAGARVKGRIETWRIKVYGYYDGRGYPIMKPDGHAWGDDRYR